MKHLIIICTFLFSVYSQNTLAQGDGGGRVRKMRVEYVKERLHLSQQQAEKFWPIYMRYLEERSALRAVYKNQFKSAKKNQDMSNYQANRFVDDNIEYKEKDLQLSKKFKNEFLSAITPEQLATLYQTEREFKQMLIEKLRDR